MDETPISVAEKKQKAACRMRKWRSDNPERNRETDRRWKRSNKKKLTQSDAKRYRRDQARCLVDPDFAAALRERKRRAGFKYWINNKEKVLAAGAAYDKKNPTTRSTKARYRRNPNPYRARRRRWVAANPQRARTTSAKWRLRNPEKLTSIWKRYYAANKAAMITKASNRRAKLMALGKFTHADVVDILAMQTGRCAICAIRLTAKIARDHIVPLCLGGTNTRQNLQITCNPCNLKKGGKDPIDFMQSLGLLL